MKMRKRKMFYSCCTAYRYVANGIKRLGDKDFIYGFSNAYGAGVICVVFDRIEQVEKDHE